ncbi:hypothetical protein [Streptomyces sp. SID12488]|uniref:hypothetical protein n=1 Tax=Streptomyces sp. SID12488 TaxID=2706040 RepID=UPI0013DA1B3B|nr:hypothetical protein [Streptomyces sp. SID12488]NEA64650.1 hypothetical protein [Streptomyces sp. SID12488]
MVLIDDTEVGRVGRGQTLHLDVPSGAHQVQLKVDWCSSEPLVAVVEPGETVFFACCPGGAASDGLRAVIDNKDDYITLRQTPEPIVMAKSPLDRRTRFLLGAAFGFFGGGLTLIGAWIWRYTGVASGAADVVAGVSLAVVLASMIVLWLCRRRVT